MSRALSIVVVLHLCVTGTVALRAGQQVAAIPSGSALPSERTGQDIFRAACASCHGVDGKGMARNSVGFETPLPDFTDCAFATAEADPDWHAVVTRGGRIRGLDRHMPSFGDALTPKDIEQVVEYVRGFCGDRRKWPQGDLNFPRAFFTEKAFPENEVVWTTGVSRLGGAFVDNSLIYERRIGPRNQIELVGPVQMRKNATGSWTTGIGNAAFAFRRTFYSSMKTGAIAAAGGEITWPTGTAGFGRGDSVVEPFAMYGQALPRNSFFQLHGGLEFPTGLGATNESYLRTAIGTTLQQDHGVGRAWSPQIEVLWAREWGAESEWDVVPQLQVTLSKIQHVRVAFGARIPVNERQTRPTQGLVYFVWDWADGGLFQFWK